ncbi:hypothetical protein JCM9534A_75000 [Catenuloplanes indicus JCM 9534]
MYRHDATHFTMVETQANGAERLQPFTLGESGLLPEPLRGLLPEPLRGLLPEPLRGLLPEPLRGLVRLLGDRNGGLLQADLRTRSIASGPAAPEPDRTADALLDPGVRRRAPGMMRQPAQPAAGRSDSVPREALVGLQPVGPPQASKDRAVIIAAAGRPDPPEDEGLPSEVDVHVLHADGRVERTGEFGDPEVFVRAAVVAGEERYVPLAPSGRAPATGIPSGELTRRGVETIELRPIAAEPGTDGRDVLTDAVTEQLARTLTPGDVAWAGWTTTDSIGGVELAALLHTDVLFVDMAALLGDGLRIVPDQDDETGVPETLSDVSITVRARRSGTYRPESVSTRDVGYGGRLEIGVLIEGLGAPLRVGPIGVWERVLMKDPPALLTGSDVRPDAGGETVRLDAEMWSDGRAVLGGIDPAVLQRIGPGREQDVRRVVRDRLAENEPQPLVGLRVGVPFVLLRIGGQYRAVSRGDLGVVIDGRRQVFRGAIEILLDVVTAMRVLVPRPSVPADPPDYSEARPAPVPPGADPDRWVRLQNDASIGFTPARLEALRRVPGHEDLGADALTRWIEVIDQVPDDIAGIASRIGLAVPGPFLMLAARLGVKPRPLAVFGPHLRALAVTGGTRPLDLLDRLRPAGVRTVSDIVGLTEVADRLDLDETDLPALLSFAAEQVAPELLVALRDADLATAMDTARMRMRMRSGTDLGASVLRLRGRAELTALASHLGVKPEHLAGIAARVWAAVSRLGSPYGGPEPDVYEERVGERREWREWHAGQPGPWQAWPTAAAESDETAIGRERAIRDALVRQYQRRAERITDEIGASMRTDGLLDPIPAGAGRPGTDLTMVRNVVGVIGRLGAPPSALAALLPSRHVEFLLPEFFGDVPLALVADHVRTLAGPVPPPDGYGIGAAERSSWIDRLGVTEETIDRLMSVSWADPLKIVLAATRAGLPQSALPALTELTLKAGVVPELGRIGLQHGLDTMKVLETATRTAGGVDPAHLMPFATLIADPEIRPDELAAALTGTADRISPVLDDKMRLPWVFRQAFRWMHGTGGDWFDTAHLIELLVDVPRLTRERYVDLFDDMSELHDLLQSAVRIALQSSLGSGPLRPLLEKIGVWASSLFKTGFVDDLEPLSRPLEVPPSESPALGYDRDGELRRQQNWRRVFDPLTTLIVTRQASVPREVTARLYDAVTQRPQAIAAFAAAYEPPASGRSHATWALQSAMIRWDVEYAEALAANAATVLRVAQVPAEVENMITTVADRLVALASAYRLAKAEHPVNRTPDHLTDVDIVSILGSAPPAVGREALDSDGVGRLAVAWFRSRWSGKLPRIALKELEEDLRVRPWLNPQQLHALMGETEQLPDRLRDLAIKIHRLPVELPRLARSAGVSPSSFAELAVGWEIDPALLAAVFGDDPAPKDESAVIAIVERITAVAARVGASPAVLLESLALSGYHWHQRHDAPDWNAHRVLSMWMGVTLAPSDPTPSSAVLQGWRRLLEELATLFGLDRHSIADLAAQLRVPSVWVLSHSVRIGRVPTDLPEIADRLGVAPDALFAFTAMLSIDPAVLTADDEVLAALARRSNDSPSRFNPVRRAIAGMSDGAIEAIRRRTRTATSRTPDPSDPGTLPVVTESLWRILRATGDVPAGLRKIFAHTRASPRLLIAAAGQLGRSLDLIALAERFMPLGQDKGSGDTLSWLTGGFEAWVTRLGEHAHLTEAELLWADEALEDGRRDSLRRLQAMEPQNARMLMLRLRLQHGRLTQEALAALVRDHPHDAADMVRDAVSGRSFSHQDVPVLPGQPVEHGVDVLLTAPNGFTQVQWHEFTETPDITVEGQRVRASPAETAGGWEAIGRLLRILYGGDGRIRTPSATIRLTTRFGDERAYVRLAQLFYGSLPVLRRMGLLAPAVGTGDEERAGWVTVQDFLNDHQVRGHVMEVTPDWWVDFHLDAVTPAQLQAAAAIFSAFVAEARTPRLITDLDTWAFPQADAYINDSGPLQQRHEEDFRRLLPLISEPVARLQAAILFQVVGWAPARPYDTMPHGTAMVDVRPPPGIGPLLDGTPESEPYVVPEPRLGEPVARRSADDLTQWLRQRVADGLHPVPHTADRPGPTRMRLLQELSLEFELPLRRTGNSWTSAPPTRRLEAIAQRLGGFGAVSKNDKIWTLYLGDLNELPNLWQYLGTVLDALERFGATILPKSMSVGVRVTGQSTEQGLQAVGDEYRDVLDRLTTDPAADRVRSRAQRATSRADDVLTFSGLDPVLDLPVLQVHLKTLIGLVALAEARSVQPSGGMDVDRPSRAGAPLGDRWRMHDLPAARENRFLAAMFPDRADRWQALALFMVTPWHPGDDHEGLPYGVSVNEAAALGRPAPWPEDLTEILHLEHPAFAMAAMNDGLPAAEFTALLPARFLDDFVERARAAHLLSYPGTSHEELRERASVTRVAWSDPDQSLLPSRWWTDWYAALGMSPAPGATPRRPPVVASGDRNPVTWITAQLDADLSLDVLRDLENQLVLRGHDEPARQQRMAVRQRIAAATGTLAPRAAPGADLRASEVAQSETTDLMVVSVFRSAVTQDALPTELRSGESQWPGPMIQYVIDKVGHDRARFETLPGRTVGELVAQALPIGAVLALHPSFRLAVPDPGMDGPARERLVQSERVRLRRELATRLDTADPVLLDLLHRSLQEEDEGDADPVLGALKAHLDGHPTTLPTRTVMLTTLLDDYLSNGSIAMPELLTLLGVALDTDIVVSEDGFRTAYGPRNGRALHIARGGVHDGFRALLQPEGVLSAAASIPPAWDGTATDCVDRAESILLWLDVELVQAVTGMMNSLDRLGARMGGRFQPASDARRLRHLKIGSITPVWSVEQAHMVLVYRVDEHNFRMIETQAEGTNRLQPFTLSALPAQLSQTIRLLGDDNEALLQADLIDHRIRASEHGSAAPATDRTFGALLDPGFTGANAAGPRGSAAPAGGRTLEAAMRLPSQGGWSAGLRADLGWLATDLAEAGWVVRRGATAAVDAGARTITVVDGAPTDRQMFLDARESLFGRSRIFDAGDYRTADPELVQRVREHVTRNYAVLAALSDPAAEKSRRKAAKQAWLAVVDLVRAGAGLPEYTGIEWTSPNTREEGGFDSRAWLMKLNGGSSVDELMSTILHETVHAEQRAAALQAVHLTPGGTDRSEWLLTEPGTEAALRATAVPGDRRHAMALWEEDENQVRTRDGQGEYWEITGLDPLRTPPATDAAAGSWLRERLSAGHRNWARTSTEQGAYYSVNPIEAAAFLVERRVQAAGSVRDWRDTPVGRLTEPPGHRVMSLGPAGVLIYPAEMQPPSRAGRRASEDQPLVVVHLPADGLSTDRLRAALPVGLPADALVELSTDRPIPAALAVELAGALGDSQAFAVGRRTVDPTGDSANHFTGYGRNHRRALGRWVDYYRVSRNPRGEYRQDAHLRDGVPNLIEIVAVGDRIWFGDLGTTPVIAPGDPAVVIGTPHAGTPWYLWQAAQTMAGLYAAAAGEQLPSSQIRVHRPEPIPAAPPAAPTEESFHAVTDEDRSRYTWMSNDALDYVEIIEETAPGRGFTAYHVMDALIDATGVPPAERDRVASGLRDLTQRITGGSGAENRARVLALGWVAALAYGITGVTEARVHTLHRLLGTAQPEHLLVLGGRDWVATQVGADDPDAADLGSQLLRHLGLAEPALDAVVRAFPVLAVPRPALDTILQPGPALPDDVLVVARTARTRVAGLVRADPVVGRVWAEAMRDLDRLTDLSEPGVRSRLGEAIRQVARLVPDETHAAAEPLLALDAVLRTRVFPGAWWPAPMPFLSLGEWSPARQGNILGAVRAHAARAGRPVIAVDLSGTPDATVAVIGELTEAVRWYDRIGPAPLVVGARSTRQGRELFDQVRAVTLAVELAGSRDRWRLRDVHGDTVGDLTDDLTAAVFDRAGSLSRGEPGLPVALAEWLRTRDPDPAEAYHRKNWQRLHEPRVFAALDTLIAASPDDARLAAFRAALEIGRGYGGALPETGPRPAAVRTLDVEPVWAKDRRVPATFVYDFARVTGDRLARFPWDGLLFQMLIAGALTDSQVMSLLRATAVTSKDRANVAMTQVVIDVLALPNDEDLLDADPLTHPRLRPIFDRIAEITRGVDGSYEDCLDPSDRVVWTGRLTPIRDGLRTGDEFERMRAELIDTVTYAVSNC